jgi:hypothetical protein
MVNTCHLHKYGKQGALFGVRTEGTEWKKIGTGSTYMNLNDLIVRKSAGFVAPNLLIFYPNRTSSLVLQECPREHSIEQEGSAIGV